MSDATDNRFYREPVTSKELTYEFGEPEEIIRVCEDCDGSGIIEWAYHANSPHADGVNKCSACDGTGEIFHPFVPVELADLWQQWAESLDEAIGL